MSKIVVVNEKDEIVGYKDRDDRNNVDIVRVAALWIFNSSGESLLAQRSLAKTRSPGKWGPAVAGTVEEGETYESNIIKETEEEIGLTISKEEILLGEKKLFHSDHPYFGQMYYLKIDLPISGFRPRPGEVEQVKWFGAEQISQRLKEKPEDFTPSMKELLSDYLKFIKDS